MLREATFVVTLDFVIDFLIAWQEKVVDLSFHSV